MQRLSSGALFGPEAIIILSGNVARILSFIVIFFVVSLPHTLQACIFTLIHTNGFGTPNYNIYGYDVYKVYCRLFSYFVDQRELIM